MDHTTLKLHLYSDVLSSVQLSVSWFEIWNLFAEILIESIFKQILWHQLVENLWAVLRKYSDSNWWSFAFLQKYGRKIHGKYKDSDDLTKIGRSFLSSCGLHQRVCKDGPRNQKPIQSTSPNAQLRPKTNLGLGYLANGCIWKDPINSVIKCRVASSFLIKVDFVEN